MKYYYDFGYFFSNKDSGSLRVTTTEPLDADDTDGCVEYALEHNLIDEEYAGNIIYVEQLTKEDARDMGFDVDDDESTSKETAPLFMIMKMTRISQNWRVKIL